jgi:hypothetical protein
MNVYEAATCIRQKWDRFNCPVAIGLDATKFDMHVSVPALKYEHSFYTAIFPRSRELRRILSWQLYNRGTAYCADGKVKFCMPGTRSSGDLNTSLGNCILMCAMVYSQARASGVEIELCNNGDDCVVIMERANQRQFMQGLLARFTRFGFRMEVEPPVYEFEQIDFCQSSPVWTASGYVMVRNVRSCFKKDPMCLVPIQNDRVLAKWRTAVGDCGAAITRGVPVMYAWYNAFRRNRVEYSEGFLDSIIKNSSVRMRMRSVGELSTEITPDARCSFYYAFGINPNEQIALEAYFDSLVIDGSPENVLDLDTPIDKFNSHCHPLVAALC